MKTKTQILIGLLISLAISGIVFLPSQSPRAEELKIVRVIDGDTIIDENRRIIRILGIDTPEKNEKGFQEAKQRLESLILNKRVQLLCSERDKFERWLCWIFLDGQNIVEILILEGLEAER